MKTQYNVNKMYYKTTIWFSKCLIQIKLKLLLICSEKKRLLEVFNISVPGTGLLVSVQLNYLKYVFGAIATLKYNFRKHT